MNAHHEAIPFTLPVELQKVKGLERLFDTADGNTTVTIFDPSQPYLLQPRSMALFRRRVFERRELVVGGEATTAGRIVQMMED